MILKKRYKWFKLFLSSVRMLLNIIFLYLEILDNIYIYPWLVHFTVSIVNVLHSKDAINSNKNALVMEVCIVRIILQKLA